MHFDGVRTPNSSTGATPGQPIRAIALAFARAIGDLFAPTLRRVVLQTFQITICTFVALWVVVGFLLGKTTIFAWTPLDLLAHALGVIAVLASSWLLFPAIATMLMGCFFERIATAVEARSYPGRAAPRSPSIRETVRVTMRLMALTILINILALPGYVLAPGLNFFVFFGLNGYLFGREYFEVVALRRLDPVAARALRQRFAGQIFVGGIAIAGLFMVPLVNLVAPVLAIAAMMHLFEALRGADPRFLTARSG